MSRARWLVLTLLWGCAEAPARGPDAEAPRSVAATQTDRVGRARATLERWPGQLVIAARSEAPGCWRLRAAGGAPLGPASSRPQPTPGAWLVPTLEEDGAQLEVEVERVDCGHGGPLVGAPVAVELSSQPARVPTSARLKVALVALGGAVVASELVAAADEAQGWLAGAVELEVEVIEAPQRVAGSVLPAAQGAALRDQLGATGWREGAVVVLVADCLRSRDELSEDTHAVEGWTERIPGGLQPAPDDGAVWLAWGCAGDAGAQRMGLVLAHELGHHLGLVHGEERGAADGQEEAEAGNLMSARVSEARREAALTPDQIAQMRAHPLLGR
jgi:hypothetical protein